jgi:hypothetical protein
MPKYFFRLSSDDHVPKDGEELPGPEQAAIEAAAVARELAANARPAEINGKSVVVTDQAGAEIFRASLGPAS